MQAITQQSKEIVRNLPLVSDEMAETRMKYLGNMIDDRKTVRKNGEKKGSRKYCVCNPRGETRNPFGSLTRCSTCGWLVSASLPVQKSDNKFTPTMSQTWGYGNNNGPLKWYQFYSIAKDGKRQSPIDIVTAKAEYDPELPSRPFLVNYMCEKNMELENNGHSVKAQMKERSELSGGPLEGMYLLEQFHLHWGAENGKGSEHTIDGQKYDAELHLVHYNSKYGSFANAADKEDGLAVFGFMVKVGKSHAGFEKISNGLQNVMVKGKKTKVDSFNPRCLFDDPSSYWTYKGSLTTPPLYESVIWIVFKSALEISQAQMDSLRSLKDSDGDKIVDNYRPPLPVGDRIVNCSFH